MGADLLERLGRRGKLTITVEDGTIFVRLVAPGPYVGGRCTIDKADLFENCRLGAKTWEGEGADLAALLVECAEATRPPEHDIEYLRSLMESRRQSRVHGPPLPTYQRWSGWRPGIDRWLHTYSHAREYLGGYLHYGLAEEAKFEAERRADEEHRRTQRQFATKAVLG